MPSWKKVIVSGSAASLSSLTTSGNISGSSTSTGSFGELNIKQQRIYEKSNDLVLESTPDHIVFRTGANDGAALDKNGSFIIGRGANVPATNHSGGNGSLTVYNSGTPLIKIANSTTGQDANSGTDLMGLGDEFLIINREAGDIRLKTNNNNFIFDGVANTWSGSSTSTGSFGKLLGDGSDLTGVTSDVVNDTSPQLGGNLDLNSNDITGTGNIDITGNITAQNFIVSSSVTSITYQSLSGSTLFGDTLDDRHRFTGSLFISASDSTGVNIKNTDVETILGANAGVNGYVGTKSNTPFNIATNNVRIAHFTTGGSLGVGAQNDNQVNLSSVTRALTINGSGAVILELAQGTTRKGNVYHDGTNMSVTNNANGTLAFLTDNTERMKISSDASSTEFSTTKISGSSTSTGSFGKLAAGVSSPDGVSLEVQAHQDIARFKSTGDVNNNVFIDAVSGRNANLTFTEAGTPLWYFGSTGGNNNLRAYAGVGDSEVFTLTQAGRLDIADEFHAAHIVSTGVISGSATSTGSFGHLLVGGSEIASSPDATDGSQDTISGSSTSTGSFGHLMQDGKGLLPQFTTGSSIFIGENAGVSDDGSDNRNIGIGKNALDAATTGQLNIAIGDDALTDVTTGNYNVAIGFESQKDTTGGQNVSVGYNSLEFNTSGNNNVAIGYAAAGGFTYSGISNIAIGFSALGGNSVSGDYNIAIGHSVMGSITTADDNLAIGDFALTSIQTSTRNIAIGSEALRYIKDVGGTHGFNNTALGWNAGKRYGDSAGNLISASYGVFIGHTTFPLENDSQNEILIGSQVRGKGSNTATIGDGNITDIYLSQDQGATVHTGNVSGSSTSTGSFGSVHIPDRIGINTTAPKSQLHLFRDDSITHGPAQATGTGGLLIEQDGTGDAVMEFLTTGAQNYIMGIDNSESDVLKITPGQFKLGDGTVHFTYGSTGIMTLQGTSARLAIGSGTANMQLDVTGFGQVTQRFRIGKGGSSTPDNTLEVHGSGMITGSLTVEENISGSSTSTGSFGHVMQDGKGLPPQFTTGSSIFIGENAGASDDGSDNRNIGIGKNALDAATTGHLNIAIGDDALTDVTTGNHNVAIGFESQKDTTGGNNTSVGYNSLEFNTSGNNNVAIGYAAAGGFTYSGADNVAIGFAALGGNNVSGDFNIAIGKSALYANTTADDNLAIGDFALTSAGTDANSSRNLAIGSEALRHVVYTAGSSGFNNTALGWNAGKRFGDNAGNLTSASYGVYIGHTTYPLENNSYNEILIGSQVRGKGSNTATIGDGNITDIYLSQDQGATVHTGNVSGSSTSTGSFGKLLGDGSDLTGISSDVVNDTSPQLGGNLDLNSNDITGTGNIDITGNITAQNFIVSSSVTSITYQSLSGSTIFGDTGDDTHQFTGSLDITGSLEMNSLNPSVTLASIPHGGTPVIRFVEGTNFRGGFVKFDGASNVLKIGTHEVSDSDASNDIDAITMARGTGIVTIPTSLVSDGDVTAAGYIAGTGAFSSQKANILNNFNNFIGLVLKRTGTGTSDFLRLTDSSENTKFSVEDDGTTNVAGNFLPTADNNSDLGAADKRWANIYSADLQLSNEGTEGNEVDGTTGNWTIQEGEDDLYLLNRKNGKKYKFKLEEVT